MRKTAFIAAAVAGLSAAPALAADISYPAAPPPSSSPFYAPASMVTGDIAVGLGYVSISPDAGGGYDTGEIIGNGRINIPLGPVWNETVEIGGLAQFEDDGANAIGAFSHTFYRDQQFAAGFVLGGTKLEDDGVFTAGVEGALFAPTTTWTGLVAYNWGSGGIPDFWLASGEVRWYWNPNTRLSGIVTYMDNADAWVLTAGLEHRFDGSQFSLFGNASYLTNDGGDGYELIVGGRWFFDQPGQTLQGHDHAMPFAFNRTAGF